MHNIWEQHWEQVLDWSSGVATFVILITLELLRVAEGCDLHTYSEAESVFCEQVTFGLCYGGRGR